MYTEAAEIQSLAIHHIGNSILEERLKLSESMKKITGEFETELCEYFLSSFKSDETFQFFKDKYHEENPVWDLVDQLFQNELAFLEISQKLASYLYDRSAQPKVKGGDFFVVRFPDCLYSGQRGEAVGLFKSETRESFIKVLTSESSFHLQMERGIPMNKLDKACLIFKEEEEEGYILSILDSTSKGSEPLYWTDLFLQARPRKDEYYQTQNVLSLCKQFVTEALPGQFEISKADQADFLNKSVRYFKENEQFDIKKFEDEVMVQPEVIECFQEYKTQFERDYELPTEDTFEISESAVKKQSRVFKSVIKLDKNFHIYVHGNREMIEQGTDDQGRKYYKIFYQEEA